MKIVLACVGVLAALAIYHETIGYGLHYDDYHTIRPWSAAELRASAAGNWDQYGVMVPFYRPLTNLWYAARFEVFGLDARPQHLLSIAGVAVCALLVGLFVRREGGSAIAAVFASIALAVHPSVPYAMGVWLTNQMHLIATLVVLAALLTWQRGRRPVTWSIVALAVIGFGLKEDTIMLLPAIVVLAWLRARILGEPARGLVRVAVVAVLVMVALLLVRQLALGEVGGYSRPSAARMWENFTVGIDRVLRLSQGHRPLQPLAGGFVSILILAGVAAAMTARAVAGRYLIVAGLAILAVFNLPFVLVTKQEQYHLLTVGAVIALAGAVDALRAVASHPRLRQAAAAVAFAGLVPLGLVARDAVRDFAPCSPNTLSTDQLAAGWYTVPSEIKHWLAEKAVACRSGSAVPALHALPIVTWGAYDEERSDQGYVWRWTSGRTVMMLGRDVKAVSFMLRDPTPATPVRATVDAPGFSRTFQAGDAWQYVDVPIARPWWTRVRARRVRLAVAPTFVPALVEPGSQDRRALGVQLRAGKTVF